MTEVTRKSEREGDALRALLGHLKEARGEEWIDEGRPDEIVRNEPACDYILTHQTTGQRAILEITQFDWPTDQTTTRKRLGSLARRLQDELADVIEGQYTLAANINQVTEAGLFRRKNRKAMTQKLKAWFPNQGAQMKPGETVGVPDVPGLAVTRHTLSGTLSITVPATVTSIEYPNWISDLESVMEENARKFDGIVGMCRWLLILFPGIAGRLKITGPVLSVPSDVDELFFIDYEGADEDWPPKDLLPAVPRIIEYANVGAPEHGAVFDRDTGALKVTVPIYEPFEVR